MSLSQQLARQVREFHHGGNSTGVNLKDSLNGIDWKKVTTQVHSFNTIATLTFHINYYISAVLKVLQGGPLDAHDKYSYDLPPVQSQENWNDLLAKVWTDAAEFATLVEQMPESKLWEDFAGGKYGGYYRNIQGVIEHGHYHLGQIVLIKKLLTEQ